jgi:hypothetical protein
MHVRRILPLLVALLAIGVLAQAQTSTGSAKPISQEGLTQALRIGGLSTAELVEIVSKRGVAFPVTDAVESSLRAAGASSTLIDAVRENYRAPGAAVVDSPAPTPASQMPPLAEHEVLTLLQVGTPSSRVAELVNKRGIKFVPTPAIAEELQGAGADSVLLDAINAAGKKNDVGSHEPEKAAGSTAAAQSSSPAVTSLKQVHKLYVDKMGGNLDEYLRVEIAKQLGGQFQIVLNKDLAEALLVGTGEKTKDVGSVLTFGYLGLHDTATGAVSMVNQLGVVLWSSSAGDRTLLFGPLARGGTPEVASRLVQNLKKSLQAQ